MKGEPVFLCGGRRTPIGRYAGALAAVRPDDLAAIAIRGLMDDFPQIDWNDVDDVLLGSTNQAGEDNRNVARMSALLAGLPAAVGGITLNRLCASALEAVIVGSRMIATGDAGLVIAGGVESASRAPYVFSKSATPFARDVAMFDSTFGWRFVNPQLEAAWGVDTMPQTAENLASDFAISREDQDAYALRSQQRTEVARARGWFTDEIVTVTAGNHAARVSVDEHPRPATSAESLAALRPYVRRDGTVTVGNSSSLNDGAAALLLASEAMVARYGLNPLARIEGASVSGVAPRVMGIGPVPATRKLCDRLGLDISAFDVIELNEAFASQVLACTRQFGLPDDAPHVNANGGAISLGHPLGMSGTRIALAAARSLAATDATRALATMCVGVGQGVALSIVRP
ncbi:MAG: acetyl-CoA C-acyltransferase [Sphingomonas sp.]|uniref:acetyl-CoA C-acyltransferase n=1 Tax=Sphingomonas sp. TaxID=28214 RepID=UPI001AC7DCEB|nr:acetyl-CoA C-acyltransferase [Sphingomonas sp.]MBN8808444.1 acetyl-CoA C-acyltransferase [Sphingomonas sp.]